jgi:hypothetical protein
MYLSHSKADGQWYLRTAKKFDCLNGGCVRSVQEYRRNFKLLF